jgi:hypothetical protein
VNTARAQTIFVPFFNYKQNSDGSCSITPCHGLEEKDIYYHKIFFLNYIRALLPNGYHFAEFALLYNIAGIKREEWDETIQHNDFMPDTLQSDIAEMPIVLVHPVEGDTSLRMGSFCKSAKARAKKCSSEKVVTVKQGNTLAFTARQFHATGEPLKWPSTRDARYHIIGAVQEGQIQSKQQFIIPEHYENHDRDTKLWLQNHMRLQFKETLPRY